MPTDARLILASGSSARRCMLESAGLSFDIASPAVDEAAVKEALSGQVASSVAAELAVRKALHISRERPGWVIGADQMLERDDGMRFDKPGSREEAADQLRALAGRTHLLHSSAAVARDGRILWTGAETASLTMRAFDESFLASYLDREYEAVRYNVGVYRIEGPGVQLFDRIEGSWFAILGLPLLPLLSFLRGQGLAMLDQVRDGEMTS